MEGLASHPVKGKRGTTLQDLSMRAGTSARLSKCDILPLSWILPLFLDKHKQCCRLATVLGLAPSVGLLENVEIVFGRQYMCFCVEFMTT